MTNLSDGEMPQYIPSVQRYLRIEIDCTSSTILDTNTRHLNIVLLERHIVRAIVNAKKAPPSVRAEVIS